MAWWRGAACSPPWCAGSSHRRLCFQTSSDEPPATSRTTQECSRPEQRLHADASSCCSTCSLTPLETSQLSINLARFAASSEPSSSKPNPPFITSPLRARDGHENTVIHIDTARLLFTALTSQHRRHYAERPKWHLWRHRQQSSGRPYLKKGSTVKTKMSLLFFYIMSTVESYWQ